MVLFKGTNLERSTSGLSVFCARLVDKVWQGVYLRPSSEIYIFLLSLVEQAQKFPNLLPLGNLQHSMNRLILYQVSTIPSSEADQKGLMDTLSLLQPDTCDFRLYKRGHRIFRMPQFPTDEDCCFCRQKGGFGAAKWICSHHVALHDEEWCKSVVE